MKFDLKKSQIYPALRFAKILPPAVLELLRLALILAAIVSLILGFWLNARFLGLFLIWISLGFGIVILEVFFREYLLPGAAGPAARQPHALPTALTSAGPPRGAPRLASPAAPTFNLADYLDFRAAWAIYQGKNPAGIFAEILKTDLGKFVFARLGVGLREVEKMVGSGGDKGDGRSLLTELEKEAGVSPQRLVTGADLLYFLAKTWLPLKNFCQEIGVEEKDFWQVGEWFEAQEEARLTRRFWHRENLLKIPGIGKKWAFGYIPNLIHYSVDLARQTPKDFYLIGRKGEILEIEQILCRAKENNVLLVGEPGVGRHTVILGFAQKVAEGQVFPALEGKEVRLLELPLLFSQSQEVTRIKGILWEILKEAEGAGNIILVVEDFDRYIYGKEEEGRLDLTEVFAQSLVSRNLQFIALTTPKDFHRYLEPNKTLTKLFEKVEISAPSPLEVLQILTMALPQFEARAKNLVTWLALKEVFAQSERFFPNLPQPEKALDLLDEVATAFPEQTISPIEVQKIVAQKTKVPVGQLQKTEKEKLLNLEEFLHQKIVDQEEAVVGVARALKRARVGVGQRGKPIASFLFLGPTGVGKTETAKALANLYFGTDELLRFDMAGFLGEEGVAALVGSLKSEAPGQLTAAVSEKPFGVLLLDEVEKASSEVLNLFLPILDEGYLIDAFGQKISFENLMIIATSNAGAEFIREQVLAGVGGEKLQKKLLDFVLRQNIFSPEFLNRFDGVVVFKPLTPENLEEIARLHLTDLNKRLEEKQVSLAITPELVKKIAELGFDPTFGARPMRRVIAEKIETQIAEKILRGEIKKGGVVEILPEELEG